MYSAKLPFLHSEYLPKGAKKPNFEAVYDKILFYQAKPDFTLRCALRAVDGRESTSQGRLECSAVVNPISDEILEPLCIVNGMTTDSVAFNARESIHPTTVGVGAGYEAKIVLNQDDCESCGCGMINSAKGILKMRKVWEAPGEPKKELFEGYWSLKVDHGPTLRRKGFGAGDSYGGPMWAVRALTKDGDEVGIDAGDGAPIHIKNETGGIAKDYLGEFDLGFSEDESLGEDYDFYQVHFFRLTNILSQYSWDFAHCFTQSD
jgi:hypothetical protein